MNRALAGALLALVDVLVAVAPIVPWGGAASAAEPALDRMLRPVIEARAVTAQVLIERADPFGGPPERSAGRLWYQPGRGLRLRFDGGRGQEIVADRAAGAFYLYRVSEGTVYRASWVNAR